jgi:chemotaxis protein methyltransferase CheR
MNQQDYKFFEDLLRKESGLVITQEKMYLLESRLIPLAQKYTAQGTLESLAQKLRGGFELEIQRAVIEAMTTNETSFFRDITPFQRLKEDLLPVYIKSRAAQKSLKIWCAACSSGQEPYSLSMLLKEHPLLSGWRIDILATDLSNQILAQAKAGSYSQFEVQRGLPVQMLVKYFSKQADNWIVKPELKDPITFKSANLLTDIAHLGQFDIVFCRNVLIYFDVPTKAKVLSAIQGVLKQDGALFLGGAETVIGITEVFKPLPDTRGVYVRADSTFVPEKKIAAPAATAGATAPKPASAATPPATPQTK